jgi:citrate lyase beta subunit
MCRKTRDFRGKSTDSLAESADALAESVDFFPALGEDAGDVGAARGARGQPPPRGAAAAGRYTARRSNDDPGGRMVSQPACMTTLPPGTLAEVMASLGEEPLVRRRPGAGGPPHRQPVHTVYGGAHLFRADAAARLGDFALRALDAYAGDAAEFARAFALPAGLAATVRERVVEKLRREPVEDLRIDFEDGYGCRTDAEEDGHAVAAGRAAAAGLAAGTLPPFFGLRIKALTAESRQRAARTLDLFLTALAGAGDRRLPPHLVVTLPKVTAPEQVAALAGLLERLEAALGLPARALALEIMVETPRAILDDRGGVLLPRLVRAGRGRCMAAHFGAYDYTAALEVTAAHQGLEHPACDFARHVMQVALAGSGVWLADGSTTVLPLPPHRPAPGAPPLTAEQLAENRDVVHRAWRLHAGDVRRSLVRGFYQSWDLHPAQLVSRYAALHSFFLEGLDAAAGRLRNFLDQAARATRVGNVFDDAATGQGLLNSFLRAVGCGALREDEALARTGLTVDELRGRSFAAILAARKGRADPPGGA